jgi:hypothetical protein
MAVVQIETERGVSRARRQGDEDTSGRIQPRQHEAILRARPDPRAERFGTGDVAASWRGATAAALVPGRAGGLAVGRGAGFAVGRWVVVGGAAWSADGPPSASIRTTASVGRDMPASIATGLNSSLGDTRQVGG